MDEANVEGRPNVRRGLAPRSAAAIAWAAGVLSIVLLAAEHYLRVIHPASLLLLLLLLVIASLGITALVGMFWELVRGRWRDTSMGWRFAAIIPSIFWAAWGGYSYDRFSRREIPRNLPMRLIEMAGASVMEARVVYLWPHRLETQRLIMFYGADISDPRRDAAAMDQHVARMEEMTGLHLRSKIFYVRGPIFSERHVAFRGLAFGSSQSPAGYVDFHELAHAVIGQHERPDSDPPTLLSEGWAESQSNASVDLASAALRQRRTISDWSARWLRMTSPEREDFRKTLVDPDGFERLLNLASSDGQVHSWIGELTSPRWYHHDNGAVYVIGGAFADHVLRQYGAGRFVQLYFACRPGNFDGECARILGAGLDTVEDRFWRDEQRIAAHRQ